MVVKIRNGSELRYTLHYFRGAECIVRALPFYTQLAITVQTSNKG
jgi:hypothetical protein